MKIKENHSVNDKNIYNKNYLNAVNLTNKIVFNKDSKFINIFSVNIIIKEIFININLKNKLLNLKKKIN